MGVGRDFSDTTNWQIPRELPDLRRVGIVALDTEENDEGLRADRGSGWPWRGGHVAGISVAWRADGEMHAIYIPLRHPDTDNFDPDRVFRWLKDLVASDVRIVTHNGIYDFGWLRAEGGVVMPPSDRLEETGALATMIDENQFSYSLNSLCGRYGLPGKDETLLRQAVEAAGFAKGRKEVNPQEHIWRLPARYVGPYAEADAFNTLLLFEKLNPILAKENIRSAYRLEIDLLPMVLEMRLRGIRIDQDAAEQARDLLLTNRDAALAKISEQHGAPVGMDEINGRKWKEKTFEQYGIPFPRTEKGNPSFSAGKSGWMATHPHWLPQLIATASKYDHAGSTFLEGHILEHLVGDRIYGEINPHRSEEGGTRSFRFSYSNPPLQQMPSRDEELGPLIRRVFLPEEGELWCTVDCSQQEFRFVAHHAAIRNLPGAKEAVRRYRTDPDTDFHALASEMTGLQRKDAKNVNFAKIYGAGVKKFAEMIGKPLREAQVIYTLYDQRLPFLLRLADAARHEADRLGYTVLYDSARRHWDRWAPRVYSKGAGPCSLEEAQQRIRDPGHPWYHQRLQRVGIHTALNAQIQGDAARHTKLWMRAVWREGVVPLLQMHDGLELSVTTREQGELVARLACEAVELEVPMRADINYGHSWGDAKHSWEELHGIEPARATTEVAPIQPQDGGFEGTEAPADSDFRTTEPPGGSEFEHNPVRAENDDSDERVEARICAQCRLNPPDGSEQVRRLSTNENLWLHRHCEDAFIRRRMAEEGISWSTMPGSTAPAPSVEKTIDANGPSPPAPPPPSPTRAAPAKAPPPLEIELTRLTKDGGPLTKQISLSPDGTLVKDGSACVMAHGTAERVRVAGVDALGALIEDLAPSQALALGTLRADLPDRVQVTTKKRLVNGAARPDIIARTGANIIHRGPAFALLDYDSKGISPAVAAELERAGGFWGALLMVLPALKDAARVTRRSTSAGLSRTDTGEALPGSDGIHVYVAEKDGADSERFLRALHDRCWLAGFGWMMVSTSGALLERSIVDRMVGGPERLVFEGGPVLVPPLQQDRESRRPIAVDGATLDTVAVCPPLSIVEQTRLNGLRAKERERLAPEMAKAREAFVETQARKLVARTGMSEKAARQVIVRLCEGLLRPDIVLPFDDPELAGKTVGEVLANPEFYEGETLADPLEGVAYGRCVAKVMRRADGTPWIHSFAHGRTIYELKLDATAVRKAMEKAAKDDVVATFARLAASADLDPVELAELRPRAKELSGINLRAIDAALKAAQQQQAEQNAKAACAHQAACRQDPRPLIRSPFPDDPWLPQMDVLNEVIGGVIAARPPARDIDDDAMRTRKLPVPNTHAFTQSEVNVEPEEMTND